MAESVDLAQIRREAFLRALHRVIREEVDRIELALKEILSRWASRRRTPKAPLPGTPRP